MYQAKYAKTIYSETERVALLNTIIKLKLNDFVRDWVFFKMLFETGRRNLETRMTRMQDIDLAKGTWFIPKEHNKVKRDRIVILSEELKEVLRKYVDEYSHKFRTNDKGETFIFYSGRGRTKKEHIPYFYPYLRFYKYLEAAGMGKIAYTDVSGRKRRVHRIHDCRRSYCNKVFQWANENRISLAEVARITDHRNLETLNDFYLELSETELQKRFNERKK